MPPLLRRATPADLAVIVEYNQLLAQESENITLDREILTAGVAAALADNTKGPYVVAEIDGVVVGQLAVTTEWSDWRNGWMWWIQSVYVRPEHRRTGIFRALYEQVEQMARDDPNVIGLRLYVEHDNTAAQQTYQRMGMRRTGYLVMEKCPL